MTGPPPDDLMEWPKRELANEVERLRRIARAVAAPAGEDPRPHSEPGTIGPERGSPYGVHDTAVDARRATLLESTEVTLVDTMRRADEGDEPTVVCLLTLEGRVNYSTDRVEHAYLFGPDGAAAIVSELVHVAARAARVGHGEDYATAFTALLAQRMNAMPTDPGGTPDA